MNVFISHIHEESELATAIKDELETVFAAQVEIFLAEDLPLGSNWFLEIRDALNRADVILVVFTQRSKSRPWVNIEAGYGIMAEKKVIPLCVQGLEKSDLPVVYGLQQAMQIDNSGDIARLLEQIAAATPAGRLLRNKSECVQSWIQRISRAANLIPAYSRSEDEEPFVWIIGSDRDLDPAKARLSYQVADVLAREFVANRFRIALGRNRLLSYIGDKMSWESLSSEEVNIQGEEFLRTFGKESARSNVTRPSPNPIVILGSLRSKHGLRSIFLDSLKRIPDVALVIGGSRRGRAVEEYELARTAGIPVLALRFTGGAAAQLQSSFSPSLSVEIQAIQTMSRHLDRVGARVCALIRAQIASMERDL